MIHSAGPYLVASLLVGLGLYGILTRRNAVLLLNVPPTTTGQFAPASIKALEDFAALRRQTYDKDLALGKAVTAGTATTAAVTDDNTRTSWVPYRDRLVLRKGCA